MPFAYEPHHSAMPLQYITTALQPKLAGCLLKHFTIYVALNLLHPRVQVCPL